MMSSTVTSSGLREQERKKRSGRSGWRKLICPYASTTCSCARMWLATTMSRSSSFRSLMGLSPPLSRLCLDPARELQSLLERGVASDRRRHQEAVALVDDPLDVARVDMRMADRHVGLLAGAHDLGHRLEHHGMLILPRIAELLREVALADQDHADARHVLQNVLEIGDADRVLDHQDDQD